MVAVLRVPLWLPFAKSSKIFKALSYLEQVRKGGLPPLVPKQLARVWVGTSRGKPGLPYLF